MYVCRGRELLPHRTPLTGGFTFLLSLFFSVSGTSVLNCKIMSKKAEKEGRKNNHNSLFIGLLIAFLFFGWGPRGSWAALGHVQVFSCLFSLSLSFESANGSVACHQRALFFSVSFQFFHPGKHNFNKMDKRIPLSPLKSNQIVLITIRQFIQCCDEMGEKDLETKRISRIIRKNKGREIKEMMEIIVGQRRIISILFEV